MLVKVFSCDVCGKRAEEDPENLGEVEDKPKGWFSYHLHIHPKLNNADFQECNSAGYACSSVCLEKKARQFVAVLFGEQ